MSLPGAISSVAVDNEDTVYCAAQNSNNIFIFYKNFEVSLSKSSRLKAQAIIVYVCSKMS